MVHNKKVAIYVRVAHADEESLKFQKDTLRIFAEQKSFHNLAFYEDNGYSGLNFNRPAFIRMNEDISAGLIESVIVKDMSRLSRNMIDTHNWLNNIRAKGVSFKSIVDNVDDDSLDKMNNVLFRLFNEHNTKQKTRNRAVLTK